MFSFLRTDLTNFALVLKDRENNYVFVNQYQLGQITRLHLHQMILASLRNRTGFRWLDIYAKKFSGSKKYVSIAACQAIYDADLQVNRVKEVFYEKAIP